MKINRKSWHYKLMAEVLDLNIPRSLCPYVRQLVFALAITAIVTSVALLFGAALVCAPLGWIGVIDFPVIGEDQTAWQFLAVFGSGLWFALGLVGIGGGIIKLRKGRLEKLYYGEPKEPGLVWSYWKAVHDKVCPLLEFNDNDE